MKSVLLCNEQRIPICTVQQLWLVIVASRPPGPDSVDNIGSMTFIECIFTSVTIPNNVRSIGGNAFTNCNRITSVTIPDSMESIGAFAFYECSELTSVTIVATGKPGASATSVEQMMIDSGVSENITWNMPS